MPNFVKNTLLGLFVGEDAFKKIFQKKNVEGVRKRLFDRLCCPTFQTQWRKYIDRKLAMRFMDSAAYTSFKWRQVNNVQALAFLRWIEWWGHFNLFNDAQIPIKNALIIIIFQLYYFIIDILATYIFPRYVPKYCWNAALIQNTPHCIGDKICKSQI